MNTCLDTVYYYITYLNGLAGCDRGTIGMARRSLDDSLNALSVMAGSVGGRALDRIRQMHRTATQLDCLQLDPTLYRRRIEELYQDYFEVDRLLRTAPFPG